jgi:hypothetical protein
MSDHVQVNVRDFQQTLAKTLTEAGAGTQSLAFCAALSSSGPSPEHAPQLMLYGRFIGSWYGPMIVYRADGERSETSCEVHFGWALAGRAVQDVWIAPARDARGPGEGDRMYGTTLRVYNPQSDRWEITFIDPARQKFDRMIGRARGDDIVQEYRGPAGQLLEWCFTEITRDSFHWISRESSDEGKTWRLSCEFYFRRRS